jgi:NADH dehydrogenase FAD-containing subunit
MDDISSQCRPKSAAFSNSEAERGEFATPVVVVVGAGFGGLEAVKALATCGVRVVVLDKKNHHCFQPQLYQVATASLSPADVAWPMW